MFKVVRLGELVLIVPKSVANELRSLPEHDLSSRHLTVYVCGFHPFSYAVVR